MRVEWSAQSRTVCLIGIGQDALPSLRSIKMAYPDFRVEIVVYGSATKLVRLSELNLSSQSVSSLNFPTQEIAENHEREQLARLGNGMAVTTGFDGNGSETE